MNRLRFLIPFFACTLLVSQSSHRELRGVWISSASGDWPTSLNVQEQQRSLIAIFDKLKENNFNAVFFQVRPRGNVLYRSAIEPWAGQLTGVLGKDPGVDPLEFAIREAHQRGLELHAWFNVSKVWGSDKLPANSQHVTRSHRDWVQRYENEWWLDMGIPEARTYTEDVVRELVSSYDIDGIHFDYIRYPSASFNDWKTFVAYGDGLDRPEWRRNNITAFVRAVYDMIQKEKPWVKVGSAPLGIYQSINGAQSSFNGYSGVFQDSRRWLREGIHDYLAPQLYWTIGEQTNPNDPDFSVLSGDWIREKYGRHIYIGIGAYRPNIRDEILEQVMVTREKGGEGQIFFRYENVPELFRQLSTQYQNPVLTPAMSWKDSIRPNGPLNIVVRFLDGATTIQWEEPPPAADNEKPFRYVVYRSSEKKSASQPPGQIIAVLPASQLSYRDDASNGKEYSYSVTAVDRAGNESGAPLNSPPEDVSILARYSRPLSEVTLSPNTPNPVNGRTYVSIGLPHAMLVTLTVRPVVAVQESVIVNETKEAGIHIIAVDTKDLPAGAIEYRLKAGTADITRTMEKR